MRFVVRIPSTQPTHTLANPMAGLASNDVGRQLMNTSKHIYILLKTVNRRLGAGREAVPNVIENQHSHLATQQLFIKWP